MGVILQAFPYPGQTALYLQHLGTKSKAAVEEACNALSLAHSCAGLATPVSHPLVQATLGGLKRGLVKPDSGNA